MEETGVVMSVTDGAGRPGEGSNSRFKVEDQDRCQIKTAARLRVQRRG